MDTLVKADWFFFITAIAVVVLSLLFAVVLIFLIRILRDVQSMVNTAKKELESLKDDIHEIREEVKEQYGKGKAYTEGVMQSLSLGGILSFLMKSVSEVQSRKRTRASRKKE